MAKATVHDFTTDIYLSDTEAKEHCRLGQGADCCIWLCVGRNGFECLAYHKPYSLVERLRKGETNAKWEGDLNGCSLPKQAFREATQ